MKNKALVSILASGLLLAAAGSARTASAQQPGGGKAAATATGAAAGGAGGAAAGKTDDYGYEFSDDPLSAGGFGPNDATIRVRPGPIRTTLIKPRTTFVPEMLKSVENL